jgi:hypothetical protein
MIEMCGDRAVRAGCRLPRSGQLAGSSGSGEGNMRVTRNATLLASAALLAGGVLAGTAGTADAATPKVVTTMASTAGSWQFTGNLYADKSACVDDGQQYEREGFPYQCRYDYFSPTQQYMYFLYIYN